MLTVYKYWVRLARVTVTASREGEREVRELAELAMLGVGDSGPLGTSCSGF